MGVLSWAGGADRTALAGAVLWAAGPGLAGLALLPRLGEKAGAGALLAAWLVMAAGLVAGTGGGFSPLAAAFAIAPAMAGALGRRWAAELGAMAVLAFAGAVILAAHVGAPIAGLGAFPELMTVVSLAFAAGLMALAPAPARQEQALSRRVAEVSHELRTPLTHILGFSEMIEKQVFGPVGARYVEYAGLIGQSGAHLLGLVNDLLDLSKIDADRYQLELETFDACVIIAEVVRLSADSAAKKSIALAFAAPDAPLMVRAEPRALRRILFNTLGNALKFTPEGGRVSVAARGEQAMLVIETIDSGPGIPQSERGRLGHAYERGASGVRTEGAGLGLSLVRALAGLHGGSLSFHDAPGGGALVRVEMPVLAL